MERMKHIFGQRLQKNSINALAYQTAAYMFCLFFSICLLFGISARIYADNLPCVKAAEAAADGETVPAPEDTAAGDGIRELPEEKLVVVIDPGHGGDEEGGMYDSFVEKDMTLITAKAMKEELEKYENITVYLTREDDRKLSLEERVAYAKEIQADFLFCLHYNLSQDHNTLFGAE